MSHGKLRFKWFEYEVEVVNVENKDIEDLAFCAYVMRRKPLWYAETLVCTCNSFLDPRILSRKFVDERRMIIEQVCHAYMQSYVRELHFEGGSCSLTIPVVKAHGVYRALAELISTLR
ncbi:MAG: hypothetical protein N3F04_02090 [Candidatus Nezhaarchaeota archaeon]|nr:hypothetical protein [Candidatus Nezhaarchaeota archaeon]MCX8141569.1 hypothetical protein [Candidatus Nezhaarchaeota archaeon]MDW8049836.1 hypothetical protein [Nitrososphaerota archaeon]